MHAACEEVHCVYICVYACECQFQVIFNISCLLRLVCSYKNDRNKSIFV